MEKETTYRQIAETRYAFTSEDILEALLALHAIDLGYDHEFCIRNDRIGFHAELMVKSIVSLTSKKDDSGIVHELTQNKTVSCERGLV